MHLDERRHAERLHALDERHERLLLERGDDEEHGVRAVRSRLPDLVARDDEVLAQHRDVDGGPDGGEVGEAAAEAAPLGQDADDRGAAGLVVGGEPGRIGDGGERALARAGALHLGDDLDGLAVTERRLRRHRRGTALGERLELGEVGAGLALDEVLPDAGEDVVEHSHRSPLSAAMATCRWYLRAVTVRNRGGAGTTIGSVARLARDAESHGGQHLAGDGAEDDDDDAHDEQPHRRDR